MSKNRLHLSPYNLNISRSERNISYKHPSFLVWFTGLSCSGKTTLANAVEIELQYRKIHSYLLDGDNVRSGLNSDLSFSQEDRKENIRRIGQVSNLFVDAGVVVLAAFISPFSKDRREVRELLGNDNFIEVFVDCPLEVCETRDIKGLYKKARKGEIKDFTGISSPFEPPINPEVRVHTDIETQAESVKKIVDYIDAKLTETKLKIS